MIKVDKFWCNFDWKIDQSWLKDQKSQFNDQKYQLKDRNCQFISKKSIYFDFFNHSDSDDEFGSKKLI